MAILFLKESEVHAIHEDMIRRYGGMTGIRDPGALQSALAMPQAMFGGEYLHADLFEMTAAYLFHIVQNHPFLDGNKRTGAAVADVFLQFNDRLLTATQDEYADFVLAVA